MGIRPADEGPTAPPSATPGQALKPSTALAWWEDLKATGSVEPSIMPTVEAIRGARGLARLDLGFETGPAIPSQTLIQTEITETYTLVDQSLILPEKRTQDGMAARFLLGVDAEGVPTLKAVPGGLALELPIRMSRIFQESELVEGRILSSFYHDGLAVVTTGQVIPPTGGTLSRDGVTVTFPDGAFPQATYVQVVGDPQADLGRMWPELAGKGTLAKGFTLGFSGALSKGLGLTLESLGSLPAQAQPLLLQRVVAQGQRLVVAVGALTQGAGGWTLVLPTGGSPVLQGGSFVVLVPVQPWSWVSGTATMPASAAASLVENMGPRAQKAFAPLTPPSSNLNNPNHPLSPSSLLNKNTDEAGTNADRKLHPSVVLESQSPSLPKENAKAVETGMKGITAGNPSLFADPAADVAVVDARVEGNLVDAVSGPTGAFALPAVAPAGGKLTLVGSRWDLGITGTLAVDVPSAGQALRLATRAFGILQVLPAEGATVEAGTTLLVLTSAPMDGQKLSGIVLSRLDASDGATPVALRKELSQDGRTLVLIPELNLEPGTRHRLAVDGLAGLDGQAAPALTRTFQVKPTVVVPESVFLDRIQLPYPDDAFNLRVTIPEGAIPGGLAFSIEGLGMGSTFNGRMPAQGPLSITLKAWRGERLRVTVQFPSGKQFVGTMGRYVGPEGRVTLGPDGGRVEATDGSGAAVVVPPGAVEKAVELKVESLNALPEDLAPETAARVHFSGRLRLMASEAVTWNKLPILEMPAPLVPNVSPRPEGYGQYLVCYRREDFEMDGTPCTQFEVMDTARVLVGKLVSHGGIPDITWETWSNGAAAGRVSGFETRIVPSAGVQGRSKESFFGGGLLGNILDAMSIDAGPHFLAGQVDRLMPGEPFGTPLPGATVFAASLWGAPDTVRRAGSIVARTDKIGRYLIDSFLNGELTRDSVRMIGVDPAFGAWGKTTSRPVAMGGIFGSWYSAPAIEIKIEPKHLEDKVAPFVSMELNVRRNGKFFKVTEGRPSDELFAVVRVRDDRAEALDMGLLLLVDGEAHPDCEGACSKKNDYSKLERLEKDSSGATKLYFKLQAFQEGLHQVEALAWDKTCNRGSATLLFPVVSFYESCMALKGAPSVTLRVEPNGEKADPKTLIKLSFTEPMHGLSSKTVLLERQKGDAWEGHGCRLIASKTDLAEADEICKLYLLPSGSLALDSVYRVRFEAGVQDQEGKNFDTSEAKLTFRTRNYTIGAPQAVASEPVDKLVMLGNRVFSRTLGYRQRILEHQLQPDGTLVEKWAIGPRNDTFGIHFGTQMIDTLKVVENVPLGGDAVRSMLLVTTTPRNRERQGILWGFDICDPNNRPQLLFGVSLGVGMDSYAPAVDSRDGLIAVCRGVGSVLLIDAVRAASEWCDSYLEQLDDPAGFNLGAIVQPVYLTDPESSIVPSQAGIALVPPFAEAGTGRAAAMAVGFLTTGASRSGLPARGIPNVLVPMPVEGQKYFPSVPFMKAGTSTGDPAVDHRVWPGPLGGVAGLRITAIDGLSLVDEKDQPMSPRTVVVGVTSNGRSLAVMDESDPKKPKLLGTWPKPGTFGDTPYEILRRDPVFDPTTGWVMVTLSVGAGEERTRAFSLLDIRKPSEIKEAARVDNPGDWAGMMGGRLVGSASRGMTVVDFRSIPASASRARSGAPDMAPNPCTGSVVGSPSCDGPAIARMDMQVPLRAKVPEGNKAACWDEVGATDRLPFVLRPLKQPINLRGPQGLRRLAVISVPKPTPVIRQAANPETAGIRSVAHDRGLILEVRRGQQTQYGSEYRIRVDLRLLSRPNAGTWRVSPDDGFAIRTPSADEKKANKGAILKVINTDIFENVGGAWPHEAWVLRTSPAQGDGARAVDHIQVPLALKDKAPPSGWDWDDATGRPPTDLLDVEVTLLRNGQPVPGSPARLAQLGLSYLQAHWPVASKVVRKPGRYDGRKITGDEWCSYNLWSVLNEWSGLENGNPPAWFAPMNQAALLHGGGHTGEHFSGNELDTGFFAKFEGQDTSLAYRALCAALLDPSKKEKLKQWVLETRQRMVGLADQVPVLSFIHLPDRSPVWTLVRKGLIQGDFSYWIGDASGQSQYREGIPLAVDLGIGAFEPGPAGPKWRTDPFPWKSGNGLDRPYQDPFGEAGGALRFRPQTGAAGTHVFIPSAGRPGYTEMGFTQAGGAMVWVPCPVAKTDTGHYYRAVVPSGAVTGSIRLRKGPADAAPLASSTSFTVLPALKVSPSKAKVPVPNAEEQVDKDGTTVTLEWTGQDLSGLTAHLPGPAGVLVGTPVPGRRDQLTFKVSGTMFSGPVVLRRSGVPVAVTPGELTVVIPIKPVHHHHVHVTALPDHRVPAQN